VTETNVFRLSQPGTCADPLTEVLRNGARALLAQGRRGQSCSLAQHACRQADRGRSGAAGASRASA
jgi:putative transposase